jgi:hypothetical protein
MFKKRMDWKNQEKKVILSTILKKDVDFLDIIADYLNEERNVLINESVKDIINKYSDIINSQKEQNQ